MPVVGNVDRGYFDHLAVGLGGEVHFDGSLLPEAAPDDPPVRGRGDGVVTGLVVDVAATRGLSTVTIIVKLKILIVKNIPDKLERKSTETSTDNNSCLGI